jgi:hypothetical protein
VQWSPIQVLTTLADAILRDQETLYRITRKASSLARQYKFPLMLSATLPPSQGSFAPKLDVSSLWMFGICSATASAVHDDNYRRLRTIPVSTRIKSTSKHGHKGPELHQTPELLRCHHFVTYIGHPSRRWPRSPMLNLRDREKHSTASPEKLTLWQGSISSLSCCPPQ